MISFNDRRDSQQIRPWTLSNSQGEKKCHRKSYQPAYKRLKKNSLPDYTSKPATSTSFRITLTIIWTGGNDSVTSSTLITTCSTCLWRAARPKSHFMCGIDAHDQFTTTFNPWQYADVSPKAYSWAPHQHVEMVRTDKTWIYSTTGQTHKIEQWARSTWLKGAGRGEQKLWSISLQENCSIILFRLHSKACHFKKLQNNSQHHMNSTVHNSCSLHIRLSINL